MAIIQFQNGTKVNFNGNPTPNDIEHVAQQLKISTTPSTPPPQQGLSRTDIGQLGRGALIGGVNSYVKSTEDLGKGVLGLASKGINKLTGVSIPVPKGLETAQAQTPLEKKGEVVGEVASLATPFAPKLLGLGEKAISKGVEAAPKLLSGVKDFANEGKNIPVNDVANKLKGVASDWEKPTKENVSSFNNARKVLAKSPDTPQFLAEQKLNPFQHIEDGKYNTKDTAESFRETPGKMSADMLRPSLQKADLTTPRTSITDSIVKKGSIPSEIKKAALSEANKSFGVTADDAETINSKIESKMESLSKKYPDGMSLTDMHDEKITYAKNGGYSPVKDPAVNNNAIANRAISSALGKAVEAKAPADLPVKEFNNYLSKYYRAADYLDAIHGKKAPVSLAQNIARGIAKFGGAAAGAHLGGGIVSEFAGYQLGKGLEHALENLSNPARNAFLKNLETTNPEAYIKVRDFLGNHQVDSPLLESQPQATAPQSIKRNKPIPPTLPRKGK